MPSPHLRPAARFRTCAGVLWVVEAHGIVIGDALANEWTALAYPDQCVWDALARGRSAAEAGALVGWVADLSPEAAAALVQQCVERWIKEGRMQACPTSP